MNSQTFWHYSAEFQSLLVDIEDAQASPHTTKFEVDALHSKCQALIKLVYAENKWETSFPVEIANLTTNIYDTIPNRLTRLKLLTNNIRMDLETRKHIEEVKASKEIEEKEKQIESLQSEVYTLKHRIDHNIKSNNTLTELNKKLKQEVDDLKQSVDERDTKIKAQQKHKLWLYIVIGILLTYLNFTLPVLISKPTSIINAAIELGMITTFCILYFKLTPKPLITACVVLVIIGTATLLLVQEGWQQNLIITGWGFLSAIAASYIYYLLSGKKG